MSETIGFREKKGGYTSRYSFIPEGIIGLNSDLFTLKGGNLYIHDDEAVRMEYYGVQYNAELLLPLPPQNAGDRLTYKTISLNGTHPWGAELSTNLMERGVIDKDWFTEEEGVWNAHIRREESIPAVANDALMRYSGGIGSSTSMTVLGNVTTFVFSTSPLIKINQALSVGDLIYFSEAPNTEFLLAGQVTAVNIDYVAGTNEIVVNNASHPETQPIVTANPYLMYVKNSVAESFGITGNNCILKLTLEETDFSELFVVESDIFQSMP